MVDLAFNLENDRYICFYDDEDEEEEEDESDPDKDDGGCRNARGDGLMAAKYIARSKHPASAMFLGAVASTGEVSPQFGSLLALGLTQRPILRL